jgi:hypothetical protein
LGLVAQFSYADLKYALLLVFFLALFYVKLHFWYNGEMNEDPRSHRIGIKYVKGPMKQISGE